MPEPVLVGTLIVTCVSLVVNTLQSLKMFKSKCCGKSCMSIEQQHEQQNNTQELSDAIRRLSDERSKNRKRKKRRKSHNNTHRRSNTK